MSYGRRYFNPGSGESRGPSDEMLAVDAASEIRSLTLLYDRYADPLYRYFLACSGDPQRAERMLRQVLSRLPDELQGYSGEERSFAGWLFARASALVGGEYSLPSRLNHWLMRYAPRSPDRSTAPEDASLVSDAPGDLAEFSRALMRISPGQREIIGILLGAGLSTLSASEALRLPASLLSSHTGDALRALSRELSVPNDARFRADVQSFLERQQLTRDQRSAHLALIHGLYHGEAQPEPADIGRNPALEIVTLVAIVLLGLAGIWVWGQLTPGDSRQHEVPVAAVPEDDESTPTSGPDPTRTPVSGSGIGEGGAGDERPDRCLAADGKASFDQFVGAYNAGDFETVHSMLPSTSYEHPLLSGDPETAPEPYEIFSHHDRALADPDEITDYLRERHDAGERWELLHAFPAEHYRRWNAAAPVEMYQDWKRENPDLGMVIVAGLRWLTPDDEEEIANGRVVVDCADNLIIEWDLRPDVTQMAEPVSVTDYLSVMEPLEPQDAREIWARVETDVRTDGGALAAWDVIWSEVAMSDGDPRERVEIRTLDGATLISYVRDGQRWRLDWRGWIAYGDSEDPVLPLEITMSVPWLRGIQDLLEENEGAIEAGGRVTVSEDYSFTADVATERFFEIEIDDGTLAGVRLREVTPDGERNRPEMALLSAGRTIGFSPDLYEVGTEPRFPELDVNAPRFEIPDREWGELRSIAMTVDDNPVREQYLLSWNGVRIDLAVWPSRGGVDVTSIPDNRDDSWAAEITHYSYGSLIWAHQQFTGYPTDALWDDGRFRFELSVQQDSIQPGENDWNLAELVRLADALSGSASDAAVAGSRSRSSNYPVPSMFHY